MKTTEIGATKTDRRPAAAAATSSVSAAALLRLCGAALMLGGVLAILGHLVFHPPGHGLEYQQSPNWVVAHTLAMLSFLLGAVGALGLYVRVRDRAGVLGLVVTALLFLGFSFHAMRMADEAFQVPVIARNNTANLTAPGGPLTGAPFLGPAGTVRSLVQSAGLLGFSALMLWLGFARGGAAVMLVASIVTVAWVQFVGAGGPVTGIGLTVLQLGLGWMGYRLWRDPGEAPRAAETGGSLTT